MSVVPADNLGPLLEERIFAPLARLRQRARLYLALDGAVAAILTIMASVLAQILLDWGLKLAVEQRVVISIALLALIFWTLHRRIYRSLLAPLSDHTLALAVDRACPRFHDRIAAAVQFGRGQAESHDSNSPSLVQAVIAEACQTARDVPFMDVLNHRRAKVRIRELAGLVLACMIAPIMLPGPAEAWFRRNWMFQEIPWPQQTYIVPIGFDENGVRRVPRGEELEISAENHGRVPRSAELEWMAGTNVGVEPMTQIGMDRWHVSLGTVQGDISFLIVGGDERTREYRVIAIDRPAVRQTSVRVTPPAYTRREPHVFEQETVIELLKGSRIEIEATLNRPVATARFVDAENEVAPCERIESDRLRIKWDSPRSGIFHFELIDEDGWTDIRPVKYTLNVVADRPPEVRLKLVGTGKSVTPTAELPVEIHCEDEYGLGGVKLFAQRDNDPPYEFPLTDCAPGQRVYDGREIFSPANISAEAGQRLRMWAEAWDQDEAGPNMGRSEVRMIRTVTPADFLAELAGREMELRREFERLISAQRGLADALNRLVAQLPREGPPSGPQGQRLAALARRQDADARNCESIAARFEEILDELRVNKVLRAGDERRINRRIVEPLRNLASGRMQESAAAVAELRGGVSGDLLEALPVWQADILQKMREILANMREWEGYREAVTMLQEVIDQQAELRRATLLEMERELELILGIDETGEQDRTKSKP